MAQTEVYQPATADELVVLHAAEAALQLGRQFPDSIWPGYNLDKTPLIVYVPQKWALLLNAPLAVTGFTSYPDAWPRLPSHVLYHSGQFGELTGQLALDLPLDSLVVAAVGYAGQDAIGFLGYMVHENFHQFQHAAFGEIQWEREELYPIEDVTNTALTCLECLLLRDAVAFQKRSEEDSVRQRVRQFAAVRSLRWSLADPYVARYEQGQEINEGTAQYVQVKAFSLVPELRRSLSPGCMAAIGAGDSAALTMAEALVEGLGTVVRSGTIAPEDMPRNRVYPVAAAEGFLLDCLGVAWKDAAQRAGPDFTFAGYLAGSAGLDSAKTPLLINEAKALFDYETTYRKSEQSITAYRVGFDSALAAFESQPGVKVVIRLSGKNLSRSRYSSSRKWLVDGGSRELRDHYDVYVLQSRPGQDFSFQLKGAALLEENNWSTREKRLVFYCPKIESLILNDMPSSDVGDAKFSFEKLVLLGANFELEAVRSGSVSISASLVDVDLLP